MCMRLRYIMSTREYKGVVSEQRADSWEEEERAEEGKGEKEQSMAKDKEGMAEAGEVEKEKKRMHHCSCVLAISD